MPDLALADFSVEAAIEQAADVVDHCRRLGITPEIVAVRLLQAGCNAVVCLGADRNVVVLVAALARAFVVEITKVANLF